MPSQASAVPVCTASTAGSRLDDAAFVYGEQEYASDVRLRFDRYEQRGAGARYLARLARRGDLHLVFDGGED